MTRKRTVSFSRALFLYFITREHKGFKGAGEEGSMVKSTVALVQDLGLGPSTQMAAHQQFLTPIPEVPTLSAVSAGTRHTCGAHPYMRGSCSCT